MSHERLANAAQLSSLSDETPEGRSIVVLAKEKYGLRGRDLSGIHAEFVPFSAQTRMSGVNLPGTLIRKGSVDAISRFLEEQGVPCRRRFATMWKRLRAWEARRWWWPKTQRRWASFT